PLLTDVKMYPWQSSLAVFGIAGTLARVDGTIPDEELRETFAGTQILVDHDIHAAIRRQYSPLDYSPLIAFDGHLWDLPLTGSPAPKSQRDAIARAFWEVVTAHPGAYLAHRWAAFAAALGFGMPQVDASVMIHHGQPRDYMHRLGLDERATPWQRWLEHEMKWTA